MQLPRLQIVERKGPRPWQGDGTRLRLVDLKRVGAAEAALDQARHAEANGQGWRQVLDSLRRYGEQRAA